MSKKDTKKANPLLDEETDETETETETGADEAEQADAKPAKGSKPAAKAPAKGAKGAKSAKPAVASQDEETDEDDADDEPVAKPLIQREQPRVRTRNSIESEISADLKLIKDALAKEPKVRISIPLGIGEKRGSPSAVESVTINGYRMVLPKGEYLTVPQSVADIIERHYNMSPENTEMGEAYRLDRTRTKADGMTTDEALF